MTRLPQGPHLPLRQPSEGVARVFLTLNKTDCYNLPRLHNSKGYFVDIQRLLSELNTERNRIDQAISVLEALSSLSSLPRRGRPPKAKQATPTFAKRRRSLSAAARKRISEAMKKRWATWHGKSTPKRQTMSPAARKRLSEQMKKRWAEQKKAKAA